MAKNCCTQPTCLTYLGEGLFQYDTNCGDTKIVQTDLKPSPPSTFEYIGDTHTVVHNGVPWQLNCGVFSFDETTCQLTYTDEKQVVRSYFLRQDDFQYDADSCLLTIIKAKGGVLQIPTGVPASDVDLTLNGKQLTLQYKFKQATVTLPNSVVGCEYNPGTNTLRLLYCDGTFDEKALAKASMNCITLADGTQVITFADGCGGTKTFNIPNVTLDIDNLTVMGSTLTFTYGGDGNDDVVVVDICDIVASNCNSTFTSINPDGSWVHIDNAGNVQNYPAPPNCCTYHVQNGGVLDETAPPTLPANPPATKRQGDTLVEHFANGVAWYTCIGGAWVYNFMHTRGDDCCTTLAVAQAPVNPAQPPAQPENPPGTKSDKDTHIECHPNGLCGYTCANGAWLRSWCCVWPQTIVTSVDGSVIITPTTDVNNVTTYDLSVEHPPIPVIPDFCCINPDGSQTPILISADNKVAIPFKDIPVIGSGDVTVTYDGTSYVVSYNAQPGQTIPVYLGKDGNPLVAGDVLLQPEDFANSGVQPPSNALLLGFGPDGQCVAYRPPTFEAPDPEPNCCHYYSNSPNPVAGATPVNPPQTKGEGDTLTQCHPDGFTGWRCENGAWVLKTTCPFPAAPPEVYIGDDEPDKTANGGNYKVWFNCTDGCVYYCQEDGTWLAPKGCPTPKPVITSECSPTPACPGLVDITTKCNGEAQGSPMTLGSYFDRAVAVGNANVQLSEGAWTDSIGTPIQIATITITSPKAGYRALITGQLHVRGGPVDSLALDANMQYTLTALINGGPQSVGINGPVVWDSNDEPSIQEYAEIFVANSPPLQKGPNTITLVFTPGAIADWVEGEFNLNQYQLTAFMPELECCEQGGEPLGEG